MPEVELSAGTVDCSDTGGDQPVVVLLHGGALVMNDWGGAQALVPEDQPAELARHIREFLRG